MQASNFRDQHDLPSSEVGDSQEKKMLGSPNHNSAVLKCNYKSIMRCWEQQEQGMRGRTA